MDKTVDQYVTNRREMVSFVPRSAATVLDVGCAQGRFGTILKGERPEIELWGMEPATVPRPQSYDHFIIGEFPDAAPQEMFDAIVFNDVLEHMIDPWNSLRHATRMLRVGGVIVASLPNIRNIRTLTQLVYHGDWRYVDAGVLDRTHLRFFTARTMRSLFEDSGLEVLRHEPINLPRIGKRGLIRRALFGLGDELFAEQYGIVGRVRGEQ